MTVDDPGGATTSRLRAPTAGAGLDAPLADLDTDFYLAAIVETSDDAIYSKDANAIVRTWNPAACDLFGYDASEIIGQPVTRLVPDELAGEQLAILHKVLRGERVDHYETRRLRKDGTVTEVTLCMSPIRDHAGNIVGVSSTARDVSQTRRRERYLAAAASVSEALATSALDEPTLLAAIAKAVAGALGDSCSVALLLDDGSLDEIVHHHDDPDAVELLRQILQTGAPDASAGGLLTSVVQTGVPIRLADLDPERIRSLVQPAYWPYLDRFPMHSTMIVPMRDQREVVGVIAISRNSPGRPFDSDDERVGQDLADRAGQSVGYARLHRAAHAEVERRRAAEADLQLSEARFRRLAENAPVVIFRYRLQPDRALEYISPAITDLMGFTTDEVYADPDLITRTILPEDQEKTQHYLRNFPSMSHPLVVQRRAKDGSVRWTESRMVPVHDDDGVLIAMEGVTADITQIKAAEAELVHHASHDDLTGLANRSLFIDHCNLALARRPTTSGSIAVLFIDLDRFQVINDSLGHSAGDQVLVAAVDRLRGAVRPDDTVARVGGDEFAVIVELLEDPAQATRVAERILDAFREPFQLGEQAVHSTVSIGIAHSGGQGADAASDLLRHADAALYLAKGRGRDRYELFDERLRSRLHERLRTETEFRRALENDEFLLHYQPMFDVRTNRMVAVEALVRWDHPERGVVAPIEFLDFAEETGLIVPLGEWVLREACRHMSLWDAHELQVTVNLSAAQLNHPDAVEQLARVLTTEAPDPSMMWLEITETALMDDVDASLERLDALKALGVRLAVDDFGTGYSSLAYLQRFPIDAVKIDKSFVDGLGTESQDTQIVAAIISLARALELTVIAEGVETAEQYTALSELDCDLAQGYLLAHPLPMENLLRLLGKPAPVPSDVASS